MNSSREPLANPPFSDAIRRLENTAANTSSKLGAARPTQHRMLPDWDHSRNRTIRCAKYHHHLDICHLPSRTYKHNRDDLPIILGGINRSNTYQSNGSAVLSPHLGRPFIFWSVVCHGQCWFRSNIRPAAAGRMFASIKVGRDLGRDDDVG